MGSRRVFPWLVSIGALGLIVFAKNAFPELNLILLVMLLLASVGLIMFASPLGPVSCRMEERMLETVRRMASEYMGAAVETTWGKMMLKPFLTTPAFAAKIIRFTGAVVCIFAALQIYAMATTGIF